MSVKKTNSPVQNIIQFVAIFAVVYLLSQFIMNSFFPQNAPNQVASASTISMVDDSVSVGRNPEVTIKNNGSGTLALGTCPTQPFTVEYKVGETWEPVATTVAPTCANIHNPTEVASGKSDMYSLAPWKYSLFTQLGEYRLTLDVNGEQVQTSFVHHTPGTFTALFRSFITKPLLNAIVLIASIVPGHNLGVAIIVVTLIIKLLLFIPTNTALKSQRKLQALQPKIDALRKKHSNDPAALNKATMELWKTEKVNPFQSCLPLLIQIPVLLGLFFVIRDGSVLELSQHLLYPPFKALPWSFGTQFLGLDLTVPDMYILPVLLFVFQFIQLKLSFAQSSKKSNAVVDITPKDKKKKDGIDPVSAAEMQKKVMLYVLPLMIGFFAIQFPAAVSIYWAVSTLFAIGQQLVVNRHG